MQGLAIMHACMQRQNSAGSIVAPPEQVSIDGQDVVFKDVIEPLESVSVGMVPTPKKDVAEYGDAKEVRFQLIIYCGELS